MEIFSFNLIPLWNILHSSVFKTAVLSALQKLGGGGGVADLAPPDAMQSEECLASG